MSRLFLILALALVSSADVIVSFPEPVSGTVVEAVLRVAPSASVVPGATQDTTRASGGDCTPRVDEPEAHNNADMAAETVQPKALAGAVLVQRAGNPEDADPPAAFRTTSDRSKEAIDGMVDRADNGTDLGSAHGRHPDNGVRVRDDRRVATAGILTYYHPSLAGEPDSTRVRTTSDRSKEAIYERGQNHQGQGQGLRICCSTGASGVSYGSEGDVERVSNERVPPISLDDSRGQPIKGLLTWVHPSLAGGLMRDGVTLYDPEAIGPIAMTNYALGTWVEICGPTRRCLTAVVSDTGLLAPNHADVSEVMFQVLVGDLRVGVAEIDIRQQ